MITPTSGSQQLVPVINQLFDMEQKLSRMGSDGQKLLRNIDRIKRYVKEMGLTYENPIGEDYNETRTDCEATISGPGTENLKIVEVLKPIIREEIHGINKIIQQAVVIVQAQSE